MFFGTEALVFRGGLICEQLHMTPIECVLFGDLSYANIQAQTRKQVDNSAQGSIKLHDYAPLCIH